VSFKAFMVVMFPIEVTSSPWRWRHHGPLKRWYPTTAQHGVTILKCEMKFLFQLKELALW